MFLFSKIYKKRNSSLRTSHLLFLFYNLWWWIYFLFSLVKHPKLATLNVPVTLMRAFMIKLHVHNDIFNKSHYYLWMVIILNVILEHRNEVEESGLASNKVWNILRKDISNSDRAASYLWIAVDLTIKKVAFSHSIYKLSSIDKKKEAWLWKIS